jgi:hypothetical protein
VEPRVADPLESLFQELADNITHSIINNSNNIINNNSIISNTRHRMVVSSFLLSPLLQLEDWGCLLLSVL